MRISLAVLQVAIAASAEAVVRSTAGTGASKGLCTTRTHMALVGESREVMQVKKLSEHAILPVRGSEHAAGFDLARYVNLILSLSRFKCSCCSACRDVTIFFNWRQSSEIFEFEPDHPCPANIWYLLPYGSITQSASLPVLEKKKVLW